MHSGILVVVLKFLCEFARLVIRRAQARQTPSRRTQAVRAVVRQEIHHALEVGIAASRQTEVPTILFPTIRAGVRLREVRIGGIDCLEILPRRRTVAKTQNATLRNATLLYFHGGGYCIGSPATYRALAAEIALRLGVRCLVPHYRLAPEHPHPAPLDDADALLEALAREGVAGSDLVFSGDSAGAGLALALLLRLRDRGAPLPAAAFLLSPWVDLTLSGASIDEYGGQDILSRELITSFRDAFLAGADPRTPSASPLFADLHGLPPLSIQLGGAETLRSEGEEFARRAGEAGVEVRLRVFPGMFHVFQAFGPLVPGTGAALREGAAFLREALDRASTRSEDAVPRRS